MTEPYAEIINCELEYLANYINHLVEFNEEYNKALLELCEKAESDNITKSEDMLKYEKEVKDYYDKAMSFYNDLRRIGESYQRNQDVYNDLISFNNRLEVANFPIYESGTLELITKKYELVSNQNLADGILTGAASEIKDNNQTGIDNVTNEENLDYKSSQEGQEDTPILLQGGLVYCHYNENTENGNEVTACNELNTDNSDFYVEDEAEQQGYAGDSLEAAAEYKRKAEEEAKKKAEELAKQRAIQQAKQTQQTQQPKQLPQSPSANWIMPCNGRIVGYYGEKRPTHIHNGIDIAVPVGTPLKAVADGIIVEARNADGYGKFVVIEHNISGKIITSEYGHILRWTVSKGQKVKQGQIIAISGNEGRSQGPHCHLTLRIGKYQGRAIDPKEYIRY